MTKSLKILSLVFIAVGVLWLTLGLYVTTGEIGPALFIEIFLPVLGGMIGLWIILYSTSTQNWKFFWIASLALAVLWIGLWLIFD